MSADPSGERVAGPPPTATGTLQAALSDVADRFADEARALRGDVHASEVSRRRASRINIALLAVLAVLAALLLWVSVQNRQLNNRIADCTTAGGRCYEESGARTGKAISDLIRAQVYVAQCSRLHPGESGPEFDRELAVSGWITRPAASPGG